MKLRKGFTLIELLVVIAIIGLLTAVVVMTIGTAHASTKGCGGFWEPECPKPGSFGEESIKLREQQQKLLTAVPVPLLETSQERLNISKRLQIFNDENKVSYIYLTSYGRVMAFYAVKGKVSSVNSYMTPMEQLVNNKGNPCSWSSDTCYTVEAPDNDGSYGTNGEAIFFFTTDGTYVEWNGEYMLADQPLKLTTQPELIRQVR